MRTLLVLLAMMVGRSSAQQLTCNEVAVKYAELNRSVIIEKKTDAERYPKVKDTVTEQLRTFVDRQISEQLGRDTFPQPSNIVARIRCVQHLLPQYRPNREITNTPLAAVLINGSSAVAVAYEIYRGGAGAPDTRPVFEVFRREGQEWHAVASLSDDLTGSTFFVAELKPGKAGEKWFLLYGKRFGDSGSRLHLRVVSFDGTQLRSIWAKSGLSRTSVDEVRPDHVVLVGETTDERGRAQEFRDRYDVVADGLKQVSRMITK